MTSRLRRIRSAMLSPVALFLLSGIVYGIYAWGENPQSPTYDDLLPFEAAAEQPANGTPATLTRRTLLVEQTTRTGQTQPFFDDEPADAYFTVTFKSSRPIRQTFWFAMDDRLSATRISLGIPSPEGRSESAFNPLFYSEAQAASAGNGAGWIESNQSFGVDDAAVVVVPVDQPAGEYMLTVAFHFPMKNARYHQHWGENKMFLEIEDSLYDFTREYPQVKFVDQSRGAPSASEVRYSEFTESITLSEPAPDVDLAAPRSMRWVRDNGGISVQFLAVDTAVRFWMDRVAEAAILLFGAAVGILITPKQRDPARAGLTAMPRS